MLPKFALLKKSRAMVNFPHSDHSDVAAINTHKPQPQFAGHGQVIKYWLPKFS